MTISSESSKTDRWWQRLERTRRLYFFQKLQDRDRGKRIKFAEVLAWIVSDISYLVKWNINILLQLRAYGPIIKKNYELSLVQQWYRMAYVAFVLRAEPKSFRIYHLFKPERWRKVREFTYGRQNDLHEKFPDFLGQDEFEILKNKLRFFEFCKLHDLNTPKVLAVFEKGDLTYPVDKLFDLPPADLFIKELSGGAGRGAKRLCFSNGIYRDQQENEFTRDDVYHYLRNYSKKLREVMLQEGVKNHDSWKQFSNGSLVTCRIVMARLPDCDDVIPVIATFRMPAGKADADNYSIGGIAAPIDLEKGMMGLATCLKPYKDSFQFDAHPDTGEKITGVKVPFWEDLKEYSKSVHQKFRTIFVGWDISMTEEGFCVIEGNSLWGSNVIEGPLGSSIIDTAYPELFEEWLNIFLKD